MSIWNECESVAVSDTDECACADGVDVSEHACADDARRKSMCMCRCV